MYVYIYLCLYIYFDILWLLDMIKLGILHVHLL